MNWFAELFYGHSIAHAMVVLCLVAALGLAIGKIRIFGIAVGIAGVLFSGIVFGHFHITVNKEVLEFAREFGLILFVYTIGIEVGGGFLASLRKNGLRLNVMAAAIVIMGAVIAVLISKFAHIDMSVAVGLFSGGTTNTPSLAAAQQALKEIPNLPEEVTKNPGLGYAIAYPFGVIGIILTMMLTRGIFRIDPKKEAEAIDQLRGKKTGLKTINLEVKNPNISGVAIKDIPIINSDGVVVSRIARQGADVEVADPATVLKTGDILHVVGSEERLKEAEIVVGRESNVDLKIVPSDVTNMRMVVTRKDALGKSIEELDLQKNLGVVITRVNRAGVEFCATPDFKLQFGDLLMAVGERTQLKQAAKEVGDSPDQLTHPEVIPIFVGILLGVVLGSVPVHFPGMPAAVKLGLAGGPLVVAIALSRIGRIGPLVYYMPFSANRVLREVGIVLFLSAVGLISGENFVSTLTQGAGFRWMFFASFLTLIPILLISLIARGFYKINFLTICGLVAGSMTDPPALAFANSFANSDAQSISYASVYPLTMLLRVFAGQILVLFFM